MAGDSIKINSNINNVNIQPDFNKITVVNPDNTSVTITQPVTHIIQVAIPGPAGPTGPAVLFNSGSYVTTSSFNSFTSSIQTEVDNLTTQTSSYVTNSQTSSFATTGSNIFIGNQIITGSLTITTSITSSGNISASGIVYGTTGSFSHLQGNSPITVGDSIIFQQSITGSNILLTSSIIDFDTEVSRSAQAAGFGTDISALNTFTSSIQTEVDSLTSQTSSYVTNSQTSSFTTTSSFNSFTSSIQTEVDNLTSQTSSYVTNSQTGSFTTTSSFNNFTGSYNSGSFSGSFQGDGSGLTGIIATINTSSLVTTSSFNTFTSSIQGEVNNLTSQTSSYITNSQTGSFVTTSSFNNFTSSIQTEVDNLTSQTSSYITNSQTGSFTTTSSFNSFTSSIQTEVDNLTSQTGSYTTTSSFNNFTSSYNSGSFSGSFQGDGSGLTGVEPFPFTGSAEITGSLKLEGPFTITGSIKLDPTQDPDPTGLDLDSTVLFQSASNNSLGYDLYVRQNGNLVKWKWIEGILNTGLLHGGVVTYSGTDVFVSSGSGIIVDHNATTSSEISPIVEYVTWDNITQSISNLATQQVTYLYIDSAGTLQQQSTRFTNEQYHDYIPLGAVGHFDYTQVSAFGGQVQTAYDQVAQISGFVDAFGPLKVSGYGLTGQPGTLRLSVGSGISFIHGGFYENDPELPSQITTLAQATASMAYVYRSGSGVKFDTNGGNLYTQLKPGFYDPGTGVTGSVSNNDWTIQRVYSDPKTGVLYVYFGQTIYPDFLTAVADLSTDPFTEGDTFDFTTFIGFLVLKSNGNDITAADNKIVPAGLFRGSGQGSGGGVAISNLDDLTDVSINGPTNGEALIYNSGIWQNGTPLNATSASFASLGNGIFSGSFSGSFQGDGSGLTGVIATINTSSLVTTSSFNSFTSSIQTEVDNLTSQTGSYTITSSFNSFTSSIQSEVDNLTAQTSSYVTNSQTGSFTTTSSFNLFTSSIQTEVDNLTSQTGSYTTTSSFNTFTSSIQTEVDNLTAQTSSYVTNSQTGSFTTTSSFNLFTSSIQSEVDNLTAQTSSYTTTSSFNAFTSSYTTGSFTGSFIGDGSQLTGIVSSKWTGSNSISRQSDVEITGSFRVAGQSEFRTTGSGTVSIFGSGSTLPLFQVSGSQGNLISVNDITGSLFQVSDIMTVSDTTSSTLFTVSGSAGELFQVTDSNTGSLLTVYDSASNNIFNISSSADISHGQPSASAQLLTRKTTINNTGSFNTIYQVSTGSYDSLFADYVIISGSNKRAGNIMATWIPGTSSYTDTSTSDLGNTTEVAFDISMSGSYALLNVSASTSVSWSVKTIIKTI